MDKVELAGLVVKLTSMAHGLRGSMWANRDEIIALLDKATAALTAAEPFFEPGATKIVGGVEFAPCPTCRQYSHSLGEDQLADAFKHFQSMYSHRGDGIPTQYSFDERTRKAAQVLMAAARSALSDPPVLDEVVGTGEEQGNEWDDLR